MVVSQHHKKMKVLIIRFSSLGDIVLTTPVIRCLKEQTDAEIHFLTKKNYSSVIRHNPHITKIWEYQGNENELKQQLAVEDFDYIIDLHKNLRSHYWCLYLGKKRLTFYKASFEKMLYIKFGIKKFEKKHISLRYMKAVEPLGVFYDGKGLDLFFAPELDYDVNLPSVYTAICIGGTHFTKRFPVEKWIEVINQIHGSVILLGGQADIQASEAIEKSDSNKIINFCGKTNIMKSAFIIKKAKCVITNDTGMMHIAAALQRPIISIWGGTIPEFGFWPLYPENQDKNTTIEVKDLDCRPCSKFGRADCPKKHFKCMLDIPVESIITTLQ